MTLIRKFSVVVVLLVIGAAGPGFAHAQSSPPPSPRFAFADTTLLRDTLDLNFDRLFELSDSLGMLPDTLRALAIRYRLLLPRIVFVADSLGVPVDSVGAVLERERFNPLSGRSRRVTQFTYTSGYTVQQTSSNWKNTADYNVVRGSAYMHNTTDITIDRYRVGGQTQFRESRSAITESGWKFSPNFSLGARANLDRFGNSGARTGGEGESKNEFQVSARSRQQPAKGLTSELNFFTGLLDLSSFALEKRGLSGDLNGRLRYARGNWITHDATGQISGNVSRTSGSASAVRLNTQDFSNQIRGTLGLLPNAPASLNVNYSFRNVRVENPAADSIIRVLTNGRGLDASFRLRRDNERYVSVQRRYSLNAAASAQNPGAQNSRIDDRTTTSGRWAYRSVSLDGSFSLGRTSTEYPRRLASGGYGERVKSRSVNGTMRWNVSRKINAELSGDVRLDSYRYFVIGSFPTPPVSRENYNQSYSSNISYQRSERLTTSVGLEVSRALYINIAAASAAANNESRQYQADWRWSYRLFRGLTATQRNQMSANYTYYANAQAARNNRLTLDYSTFTTLNAVITEHLDLDVSHSARTQPSGNYRLFPDGFEYLRKSDEAENFSLSAQFSYRPVNGIALQLQPQYSAANRLASSPAGLVPQRQQRTLRFSGGSSLNLDLPRRGRLTGNIQRTYSGDRSTSFTNGVARPAPRTELDYWNGSLQVSWDL